MKYAASALLVLAVGMTSACGSTKTAVNNTLFCRSVSKVDADLATIQGFTVKAPTSAQVRRVERNLQRHMTATINRATRASIPQNRAVLGVSNSTGTTGMYAVLAVLKSAENLPLLLAGSKSSLPAPLKKLTDAWTAVKKAEAC
jgi:hypothetical protein